MAVVLYRKGKTHNVRGIDCEAQKFPADRFRANLQAGWFLTPEESYSDEPLQEEVEEESPEAPTFEEADTNNTGKLSNEEVREAAKKAGIKGYHNKRISSLKKELGYDN